MSTPDRGTSEGSSRSRKEGWLRAAGVAIGLTVAALVFATIGSVFIAVLISFSGLDTGSPLIVGSAIVIGQVGFFIPAYLYVRRYGLHIPIKPPDHRDLRYTAGGVVVALVVAAASVAILETTGLTPDAAIEDLIEVNVTMSLLFAILSILVGAPIEEFLFRGVVQGRLRETFSAPVAIGGASLLFGSLHIPNYIGSLVTILAGAFLITSVSVVFGLIYERTENLLVPIITHGVYNALLSFFSYLTM